MKPAATFTSAPEIPAPALCCPTCDPLLTYRQTILSGILSANDGITSTAGRVPIRVPPRAGLPDASEFDTNAHHRTPRIMRIRIIKKPSIKDCKDLEGFNVSHFEVGQVVETSARFAELMIVCGFAIPEMGAVARDERERFY